MSRLKSGIRNFDPLEILTHGAHNQVQIAFSTVPWPCSVKTGRWLPSLYFHPLCKCMIWSAWYLQVIPLVIFTEGDTDRSLQPIVLQSYDGSVAQKVYMSTTMYNRLPYYTWQCISLFRPFPGSGWVGCMKVIHSNPLVKKPRGLSGQTTTYQGSCAGPEPQLSKHGLLRVGTNFEEWKYPHISAVCSTLWRTINGQSAFVPLPVRELMHIYRLHGKIICTIRTSNRPNFHDLTMVWSWGFPSVRQGNRNNDTAIIFFVPGMSFIVSNSFIQQ